MNHYEAIFIVDPRLEDDQLAALKTDLKAALEAVGAQEIIELKCERRNMTFPIKKQTEGYYLIYRYLGPADSVGKLRVELKHKEQLLLMSYLRIPEFAAKPPEPAVVAPQPAPEPAAPAPEPTPAPAAPVEPTETATPPPA